MALLTAHCIVKNEENFIECAIKSVINFVDSILIFDTGSEDKTVEVIQKLIKDFPGKIIFEEKGTCDQKRHTELRQEMIERTTTKWFMILDGDEVWTERAMKEAVKVIRENSTVECLIAPFYLCVGDIFHYSWRGYYAVKGARMHATPRFFKRIMGIHWRGGYGADMVVDGEEKVVYEKEVVKILKNKFWHLTHLVRSSRDGNSFSSGGTRGKKRRLTYILIGRRISESVPEALAVSSHALPLVWSKAWLNFFKLLFLHTQ